MDTPERNFDPYAAPSVSDFSLQNESDNLSPDQRRLLKDFRSQSLALGVLWLFLSTIIAITTTLIIASSNLNYRVIGAASFSSLIMALCASAGIGTLMKRSWGIYVGLTLAYILLVLSALELSVCGVIFVIAILIQSYRILNFMKELRQAGIPLSTNPTTIRSSSAV